MAKKTAMQEMRMGATPLFWPDSDPAQPRMRGKCSRPRRHSPEKTRLLTTPSARGKG